MHNKMLTIQITKEKLFELEKDSLKLSMLEAGGVDNWEWYGASLFDVSPTYKEECDRLRLEILGETMKNESVVVVDSVDVDLVPTQPVVVPVDENAPKFGIGSVSFSDVVIYSNPNVGK